MTHRFAELLILVIFGLSGNHVAAQAVKPASPLPPLIKPIPTLNIPLAELPPLTITSYPVAAPGTYPNTYAPGNCTTYVAGRKNVPNSWGNAATWGVRAAAQGLTVSPTPIIGAIAQESLGLGHVAVVEAVSPGQVEVSEMNVHGLGVVDEAWYPVSLFDYIYI